MSHVRVWTNSDISCVAKESFSFHQTSCDGFFDWKEIDLINVDEIVAHKDIDALDKILPKLSQLQILPLIASPILDPNIRKYLQLSQISLQYLLFYRKCLDKTLNGLKQSMEESVRDNAKLVKVLRRKTDEIENLHKKVENLQNEQKSQQLACSECHKTFMNGDFLELHMKKKHFEDLPAEKPPKTDTSLIDTIKLELEVKHLKERLNLAEKDIRSQIQKTPPENLSFQIGSHKDHRMIDSSTETSIFVDLGTQTDLPREAPRESQREVQREVYREAPREVQREVHREAPRETPRDVHREAQREVHRDGPREVQIEVHRETPRDVPREAPRERSLSPNPQQSRPKQNEPPVQKIVEQLDTKLESLNKLDVILQKQMLILEKYQESEKIGAKPDMGRLQDSIKDAFKSIQQAIEDKEVRASNSTKQSETLLSQLEHKNKSWEKRLQKLEDTFVSNQERLHEDLENLNSSYSSKLMALEKTIKEVSVPAKKPNLVTSTPKAPVQAPKVPVLVAEKPSTSGVQPLKSQVTIVKEVKPPTPSEEVITSTSCTHKKGRLRVKAHKQLDLFTEYRKKLSEIGLKSSDQLLSTKKMLAIKSNLAQQRLVLKKRHTTFTSVRVKLNNVVTKTASDRLRALEKDSDLPRAKSDNDLASRMDTILEVNSLSSNSMETLPQKSAAVSRVLESPIHKPKTPQPSAPPKQVLFSSEKASPKVSRPLEFAKASNLKRSAYLPELQNIK